jgi:hypothetical protein
MPLHLLASAHKGCEVIFKQPLLALEDINISSDCKILDCNLELRYPRAMGQNCYRLLTVSESAAM